MTRTHAAEPARTHTTAERNVLAAVRRARVRAPSGIDRTALAATIAECRRNAADGGGTPFPLAELHRQADEVDPALWQFVVPIEEASGGTLTAGQLFDYLAQMYSLLLSEGTLAYCGSALQSAARLAMLFGPTERERAGADRVLALSARYTPPPLSEDQQLQSFHREVMTRAGRDGLDFWQALASMSGDESLAAAAPPPPIRLEDAAENDYARRDRRARVATETFRVSYFDAACIVEVDEEHHHASQETGRSANAWEDTSRAMPPRPYGSARDEDWQRDILRAKAAGLEVDKREWQQAAEEGLDLVFERASAARAERVAAAAHARDSLIVSGQRAEADRRREALEGVLTARARARLGR